MNAILKARLTRNFERRMGQSMLPLVIRECEHGRWRVFDPETGSWVDYELRGTRLRRVAELDNA